MELRLIRRWMWNPRIPRDFRANYMIIGAQKAGTSAIAQMLSRHPDIYLPRRKEIHFFDERQRIDTADYRFYHSYFINHRGERMVGEASPSYMYAPHVASALKAYNPNLRLIVVLRNPVDRAFSHYNMEVRNGVETLPFHEALQCEEDRLKDRTDNYSPGTKVNKFSYKERGLYADQIHTVLLHFPRDQVCVLKYEDLLNDYLSTLKQIYRFLGVDYFFVENVRANAFPYKNTMTAIEREYLVDYFSPQVDTLEQLLGWDLSAWRK